MLKRFLSLYAFFTIAFLIGIGGIFPWQAHAASNSNFSVPAVIPENQSDKSQTYFDLRMEPGQKQTIQIIITNSENEKITARAALNPATTGRNGLITYNKATGKQDGIVSIRDVATILNPEITIAAKKSATVDVEIQMPDEPFDGIILGGLVFTADKASRSQVTVSGGVSLNNEYAYVIGLKISENDATVNPDFVLKSINPGLVNYRNAVTIALENTKPLIVKGMEIEAKVYKKKQKDVFRELYLDYAEMAPNSVGDFVVDWESALLESGEYRLYMIVRYQGREWVWDEAFTISREAAGEANENAVEVQTRSVWPYVLAGAGIVTIVMLAYFLGKRNARKDDEELDEEPDNKKGIDPTNQAEGD